MIDFCLYGYIGAIGNGLINRELIVMVDSTSVIIEQCRDTVSVLDSAKVAEFYADMMSKQATNFTILISVLCGIVVIVIGATWWWNYRGAKQQISEEISKSKRALQRLINIKATKFEETIDNRVKQQLNEQVQSFSKTIQENLTDYKDGISNDITRQQAELNRVFALQTESTESFLISASWWYSAAALYNKCGVQGFVQISADAGVSSLEKVLDKGVYSDDYREALDSILQDIEELPGILTSQIKKTKNLVKQIEDLKNSKKI